MKITFENAGYSYTCPVCKKQITCFDLAEVNTPCSECNPKAVALKCPICGALGGASKGIHTQNQIYCNVCKKTFSLTEILDFNNIPYRLEKKEKFKLLTNK